MIKKAQIKFICIVMSILLAVFAIIFAVSVLILHDMNDRAIVYNINQVEINYNNSDGEFIPDKYFVVNIHKNLSDENYEYFPHFDKNYFNEEIVKDIADFAMEQPYESGKSDNIYYKISTLTNGYTLIGTDASENLMELRHTITNTLTALILIYLCLFIIVWLLSFSVFQPIQESLYKQKQFISNASHELRTPLTIISANADAVNSDKNDPYLKNIKSQTKRLNDLIEDMLSLAKLDEGKIPMVEFDFDLSQEILNNVLPFDAVAFENGKNLSVDITPDIQYKGDIQSVKKIVNILLDNAIKHTVKNGDIKATLKNENSKIIFAVYNSGSEIPTKESNKIFERFYRGDASRSRDSGGSGLGLSIAKTIADNNNWKIYAHSKFHESMTIYVVF